MKQKMNNFNKKIAARSIALLTALFWILGILLGILFSASTRDCAYALARDTYDRSLSVLGLCVIILMPTLILRICCTTHTRYPFYIFVFLKGTSLGYCMAATLLAWGNAAWLIHFLLSFTGSLILIPLFYVWIHSGNAGQYPSDRWVRVIFIFSLCIGLIDFFLISPGVLAL